MQFKWINLIRVRLFDNKSGTLEIIYLVLEILSIEEIPLKCEEKRRHEILITNKRNERWQFVFICSQQVGYIKKIN